VDEQVRRMKEQTWKLVMAVTAVIAVALSAALIGLAF